MKKPYAILLFLVIAGTFLAGFWYGQRGTVKPDPAEAGKILYYVDPMNPTHTSDKPGKAPCGMDMEPVYADGEGTSKRALPAPGTVDIGPRKQQLIGVRVSRVEMAPTTHVTRVLGWVAPDEERLYKLTAGVDGWIEEVSSVTTGSQVEKGQLLATYSVPNLFVQVQQFIFAVAATDYLSPRQEPTMAIDPASSNFRQRVQELRTMGMSSSQIDEIRKTREIPRNIKLLAPSAGFILARNATPGERFDKGAEWFRIAELSQVWILADVFESEARYLQPGKVVQVTIPRQEGVFQAQVSTALPQFDSATRTYKVRLQAENPGVFLRPNMSVNVEFSVDLPPAIIVPADAVLDSGVKTTVFVDLGQGRFEPRQVKTGRRFNDRIEILEGLSPDETIVVSGNFLIDSESRMKLAAAGFHAAPVSDPVCGLEVDPDKAETAGLATEHEGTTYHFCSPECKDHFDSMHGLSSKGQPPPRGTRQDAPTSGDSESHEKSGWTECPTCGMVVLEEKAKAAGLVVEYQGKTYSFCTRQCKDQFLKAPERYLKETSRGGSHQATPYTDGGKHD